jgi:hypothetical protein
VGVNLIESLRFYSDLQLANQVQMRFPKYCEAHPSKSQALLDTYRSQLLGNSVFITPSLLPDVYEIFNHCICRVQKFGELRAGSLYVQQDQNYNARVINDGTRFDVVLNSSLLTDFSNGELCFVLGHEIGHILFGHNMISVSEVLNDFYSSAPTDSSEPAELDLLLRWARASEISADRIGVLCAGNLTDSVTSLFKMGSGLVNIEADRILSAFRDQYKRLRKHLNDHSNQYGWIRTHPLMVVRFKAVEMTALDIVALLNANDSFNPNRFKDFDRQIAWVLDSLN